LRVLKYVSGDRKDIGTDCLKHKEILIQSKEERVHPSYNKKMRGLTGLVMFCVETAF
jgi:hypothetical protein